MRALAQSVSAVPEQTVNNVFFNSAIEFVGRDDCGIQKSASVLAALEQLLFEETIESGHQGCVSDSLFESTINIAHRDFTEPPGLFHHLAFEFAKSEAGYFTRAAKSAQKKSRCFHDRRIVPQKAQNLMCFCALIVAMLSFRVCDYARIRVCMPEEAIQVKGARVNNLKNVSFSIPINQMTVVTGVSGSGKSSLAFDTIYAEGQRRYVESLSAYARQFLERMDKPDVDEIHGIAPAIAIRQKNSTRNPRSTVGTQTEVYDYLRLLFARVGETYCRVCGRLVTRDSPDSIADEVLSTLPEGTRFYVLFPALGRVEQ